MRRKTQRLAERGKELRQRVEVTSVSARGPSVTIAARTQKVLDPLLIELKNRHVLFEDYAVEMAAAVAKSLQEMRTELIASQRLLVAEGRARGFLERMADACAEFLHQHPEINPNEWSVVRITPDVVDDLFALRQEFAAALLDMWDEWELRSAQELLNRIKLEPPDLSALIEIQAEAAQR